MMDNRWVLWWSVALAVAIILLVVVVSASAAAIDLEADRMYAVMCANMGGIVLDGGCYDSMLVLDAKINIPIG